MKKVLCLLIAALLILAPASTAFAKPDKNNNKGNNKGHKENYSLQDEDEDQDDNEQSDKKELSFKGSSKKEYENKSKYNDKDEDNDDNEDNDDDDNEQTDGASFQYDKEDGKSYDVSIKKEKKDLEKESKKQDKHRIKEKKQSFKIKGNPVINYGRYKLPIAPVTKGMDAKVEFDEETAVLTVTKSDIIIVIDFKNNTATVNGVADTESGLFDVKNNNKKTVLIKYIADALGIRVKTDEDEVIVEIPGLDAPVNVSITPIGTSEITNTINNKTLYIIASADTKAGQATGGKAELYVGSKLVATDSSILAEDTKVTFSTTDGTPTNEELKALLPEGGSVTVRLFNADNQSVVSSVNNPTLPADYIAPSVTGVTAAVYSVSGGALTLTVTGDITAKDQVDVTKISFYDMTLAKAYQLTNAVETGSRASVSGTNMIFISLGATDRIGLTGFGSSSVMVVVNTGALLTDEAGNISEGTETQNIPATLVP